MANYSQKVFSYDLSLATLGYIRYGRADRRTDGQTTDDNNANSSTVRPT